MRDLGPMATIYITCIRQLQRIMEKPWGSAYLDTWKLSLMQAHLAKWGNSNAGHEKFNEILEAPETVPGAAEHFTLLARETQQLPVVFEMATKGRTDSPFLRKVLRTLLMSEDVLKPVDLVRKNWFLIQGVLEDETEEPQSLETFLKGLPELDSLVADVMNGTFDVRESGLYVALLRSSADANISTWCVEGLSTVNREEWTTRIRSQDVLVELVIELGRQGAKMTFGSAYLDALVEYARTVGERKRTPLLQESWKELFSLLSASQRQLFARRAYEILQESDGKASEKFFDLFGDMLSNRDLLANDQELIHRVCRPILDSGNAKAIEWVARIAEAGPGLLIHHSDQAATDDFMDRVRERLIDVPADDPKVPHLKRIGTALGIEFEAPDKGVETEPEDEEST